MARTFYSSGVRLGAVNLFPLALALFMFYSALHYFHVIPPADGGFRLLVVGWCILLHGSLLGVIIAMVRLHRGRRIIVEPSRLTILEADAMVSSDWSDVSVGEIERRLGIRHAALCLAGRVRVVDELLYPDFDDICAAVQERMTTFERAARATMVDGGWFRRPAQVR